MRNEGLFLCYLILYLFFFYPFPVIFYCFSTDEEPGEEEAKEVHHSGNSCYCKFVFFTKILKNIFSVNFIEQIYFIFFVIIGGRVFPPH